MSSCSDIPRDQNFDSAEIIETVVLPKIIIVLIAILWCKLLFSKPLAKRNPPRSKKTTVLA